MREEERRKADSLKMQKQFADELDKIKKSP